MKRFELFTQSIQRISRCIQKIKSLEVEEFDVKGSHVMCLYYLYNHMDGLTSKELTILCDEDKAAISRELSFLYEKGYIKYSDNNKKRYNTKVLLTDDGKIIAKELSIKVDKVLENVGDGLSDEDRNVFYRSLIHITTKLEKYLEKGE